MLHSYSSFKAVQGQLKWRINYSMIPYKRFAYVFTYLLASTSVQNDDLEHRCILQSVSIEKPLHGEFQLIH